jgi:D-alanyl-lipoteichoic acid acyltransferase DltB (MBOAT superfamily)
VFRFHHEDFAVGASIFIIGLFKKVVIADGLARFGSPIFAAAAGGTALSAAEAWTGALAYTFQLYFDFSGYSDMAIGLARLFGIRLPLNFHSPYKATSIIEFWRRWHMTLSRFLRDYLYIPLGGNRRGPVRRYLNLFVTMLLGGLWHGAAWTFVIWGALHGLYLLVNHAWRALLVKLSLETLGRNRVYGLAAGLVTFVAVVIGWVFFRAADYGTAVAMLGSMFGAYGLDPAEMYPNELIRNSAANRWILAAALLAWLGPNTQQLFARHEPTIDRFPAGTGRLRWQPSPVWAATISVLALTALYHMNTVSEFLYFQF